MKNYKYNLLELNPPKGYRWIKTGEKIISDDVYWEENRNGKEFWTAVSLISTLNFTNPFFVEYRYGKIWIGYVRKI